MSVRDSIETREELRGELRRFYADLATFASKLDTVDHQAARDVNDARSKLFAAWSKLRVAPPKMEGHEA
jgi:hypothetical protein